MGLAITFVAALAARQTPAGQQPTNQTPDPPTNILGRKSPPQPVQKQSVEYFIGTWEFTWTGRESLVTPGPRTGRVTFTRKGDTPFLEFHTEGKADAEGDYKESGTLEWRASEKVVALHERLWDSGEVQSLGDWSSPIAIRFESSPLRRSGQMLRLRRIYAIVSATSFTVAGRSSDQRRALPAARRRRVHEEAAVSATRRRFPAGRLPSSNDSRPTPSLCALRRSTCA